MNISKVANGLILNDDFNNSYNPEWDIVPNDIDRVLFNEDSISLLPKKDSPIEMLIPAPGGKFVMQTELSYSPSEISDTAGIIIKSVTGCSVEAEFSYEESIPNEYKFIKITHTENYIVNLRSSKDGNSWDDLGNSKLYDGNYLGYYINGTISKLHLKNCLICKDKFIVIQGIKGADTVELLDSTGSDIIKKYNLDFIINGDKFLVDVEKLLWPIENITLCINTNNGNTSSHDLGNLYGGDVFSFDPELVFSVDGKDDNLNSIELGEVSSSEKNYTLKVLNNSLDYKIGKLVIEPTSAYDRGYHMAYIHSLDSNFNEKSKELEISVAPGQEFKCIVRIEKESKFINIDGDFNFNVVFIE